jgi:hypothetical protein
MVDGSIALGTAERAVFSLFRAQEGAYNFTLMEAELTKMASLGGGATDWVDKRIRQFK